MFDVAHDLLILDAPHELAHHLPGQDGVFAVVLEIAAVTRLAGDVHAAADRHVVALVAEFAPNHGAVETSGLGVPTGRQAEGGRQ